MRYINIEVANEYAKGAGVPIGAAGSYSDVALKIKFSDMWDGMSKHITWLDANGENPTIVYLTAQNYDGEYYTSLIPAEAKAVAGTAVMSIKGADSSKGTLTAKAEFKVLESVYDENAEESVDPTPTVAEQLQEQVESILGTISDARNAATEAAASAGAAYDSQVAAAGSESAAGGYAIEARSYAKGDTNTRTGEATDNAKYYKEQAASSASLANGSATEAESYAKGGTGSRTGEDTDNAKYYKEQASQYRNAAEGSSLDAEAWAVGKRNGIDVSSTDPAYNNNAKYYRDQTRNIIFAAEYGTTSYADVLSAYNAEKLIYATSSGIDGFIPLMMFDSANNRFLFSFNGQYSLSVFMLSQSNGWSIVSADVAPIASPNFTGAPTTPDLTSSSGGTQIANKNYVDGQIASVSLPSQSGHSGEFLTTDGTDASWAAVDALPTQTGQSGKFLTTNGTNASWSSVDALPSQTGQSGKFLTTNGSAASWSNTPMIKGADYVTAGKKSGTTLGTKATAEGSSTTASGNYSHAEGESTKATGHESHAEGGGTTASGDYAHAEGSSTKASGTYSHAEGDGTTASSTDAHAEGSATTASGADSHAEGFGSTASGHESHAEGFDTIANHRSQHVFGEFNVADTNAGAANARGDYVEIVGNGSNNRRSNARTLDWSGNEVLAGKLTVGTAPTNNMDVATKQYVDGAIPTNVSSFNNDSGYLTLSTLPIYDGTVV